MSQSRRPFTPTPGYRLFLKSLVQTREDRGYSIEQLSEIIGLTPAQVASFESGEHPLGFIDVRNWLLALDMPFTQFTQQMEEVLDTTLATDEGITYPEGDVDAEPGSSKYARAAPLVPVPTPTIQVLFFPPGETPEVRTIENTLEAKQALVEGLITTFETGVAGTVGVANDEALLEDMPLNREIPATGAGIFGPFFVAGDVDGGFRSNSNARSICSAPKSGRNSSPPSSPRLTAARSGWRCGTNQRVSNKLQGRGFHVEVAPSASSKTEVSASAPFWVTPVTPMTPFPTQTRPNTICRELMRFWDFFSRKCVYPRTDRKWCHRCHRCHHTTGALLLP